MHNGIAGAQIPWCYSCSVPPINPPPTMTPLQVYSLLVSFFRRKLGDGCLTPAKDTSTASKETKR